MAEASQGSHFGPPLGDPPESPIGTTVPRWLLNEDEIGYEIVLVMQVCQKAEPESDDLTQGKNTSNARLPSPLVIGASVEQVIGLQEARKVVASKENRGTKYLLRTKSRSTAEKLLKITELDDGTPVEIVLHASLNTVQGIVYEPDTINDSEDDILKSLKPQGVIKVRRIRKRVDKTLRNTPLLVLTLKGAVLPQYIYFGLLRVAMRTYYPSPLLCYNCGSYGHPKKFCKEVAICLRCSQEFHVDEGEQCQNPVFCFHCKADHPITSRDCPVYQQEVKIIQHKTDNRVSFGEARRAMRDRCRDTYASALQHRLQQVELEKDTIINELRKELEAVKAELQSLKESHTHTNKPKDNNSLKKLPQKSSEKGDERSTQIAQPCSQTPSTSTARTCDHQDNNGRKSRKDKPSKSPPKQQSHSGNKHLLQTMELRSRSRSDKRTNTSSPDIGNDQKGKRRHLAHNDSHS